MQSNTISALSNFDFHCQEMKYDVEYKSGLAFLFCSVDDNGFHEKLNNVIKITINVSVICLIFFV